jgi:hypothetical protein
VSRTQVFVPEADVLCSFSCLWSVIVVVFCRLVCVILVVGLWRAVCGLSA